jgi:tRNA pseudouridine55 synthase
MNKPEGLLLIDKPLGVTSHDVVDMVRKRLKTRKVGHAGTLDPQATGLLPILVGRYTKLFPKFVNFDKEYIGVMKLGEVTNTGDAAGNITRTGSYDTVTAEAIETACQQFRGPIQQIPPMVSAVRVNGKRLYKLARKGIEVERKPRAITIHELAIKKIEIPLVEFFVRCSKGTYIRKLAEDLGENLGCGAHIVSIVRTAIGPFKLADTVCPQDITEEDLKSYSF